MSRATVIIPRKTIIAMVAGMFVLPFLVFVGYTFLKGRSKSDVKGTLSFKEKGAFTPVRCESGLLSEDAPRSQAQFHGVDIFTKETPGLRVRVYEDVEKGMLVTLRYANDEPFTIDRKACKNVTATLKETDEMILDHWGLDGRLQLDCPEVKADISFSSCYDGS